MTDVAIEAVTTAMTLEAYAQETINLAALPGAAPDVVTEEYELGQLEEHLDGFMKLIEQRRAGLKDRKKQEILTALLQLANDFQFGSIDELLAAAGKAPNSLINVKAADAPASTAKAPIVVRGAPKVYKWLLNEKHNNGIVDLEKGHNGSFTGRPQSWHHKIGKKPDPAYYREASDDETKQMQKKYDDWVAKQAAKANRPNK
jgi:hypothetical protein